MMVKETCSGNVQKIQIYKHKLFIRIPKYLQVKVAERLKNINKEGCRYLHTHYCRENDKLHLRILREHVHLPLSQHHLKSCCAVDSSPHSALTTLLFPSFLPSGLGHSVSSHA